MNLEPGEEICSKCEGVGIFKIPYTSFCPKCHGEGKVDWVTNAMAASHDI